jgi:hypothetical protein
MKKIVVVCIFACLIIGIVLLIGISPQSMERGGISGLILNISIQDIEPTNFSTFVASAFIPKETNLIKKSYQPVMGNPDGTIDLSEINKKSVNESFKNKTSLNDTSPDTLNEMSDMSSQRLQMTMERKSKFISTMSNIMKKVSSTQENISRNL